MKNLSVVILGSSGLVGSALKRNLQNSQQGVKSASLQHEKIPDLFSLDETKSLIERTKPDILINAAAKVGGILANNTYRTAFHY